MSPLNHLFVIPLPTPSKREVELKVITIKGVLLYIHDSLHFLHFHFPFMDAEHVVGNVLCVNEAFVPNKARPWLSFLEGSLPFVDVHQRVTTLWPWPGNGIIIRRLCNITRIINGLGLSNWHLAKFEFPTEKNRFYFSFWNEFWITKTLSIIPWL